MFVLPIYFVSNGNKAKTIQKVSSLMVYNSSMTQIKAVEQGYPTSGPQPTFGPWPIRKRAA